MNLIVMMYYTNTMKEISYIVASPDDVLQYGPPLHPASNLLADHPIK